MDKLKKSRFLFVLRSVAWSLAFYIVLMTILNWDDLPGRRHEVVVTWEHSQKKPSTYVPLTSHMAKGKILITEENG